MQEPRYWVAQKECEQYTGLLAVFGLKPLRQG